MAARKPNNLGGYGKAHKALRAAYAKQIAAGGVKCSRCPRLVLPGEPWHLDHRDDRMGYLGPAHASCNLRAGALKTNRARKRKATPKPLVRKPKPLVRRTGSREW